MRGRRRTIGIMRPAVLAALAWTIAQSAPAQTGDRPRLELHQTYIEEALARPALDVNDPMAVFAFVFASLPDTVKVYPTENYYYFRFMVKGVAYAGNIRLDASNRDQGKVEFDYYEDTTGWREDTPGEFRTLDQSNGVTVERIARLRYRVTYRNKSVVFELNDLSGVKPPAGSLSPHETFIGPVFDDSGIRFFLVYNAALNNFLFILDETVDVADGFFRAAFSDRILVGKRTGFVFYRDHRLDRKIMIGAYEENVRVNNYLDGPFDQLPDNFIEGHALRDAILKVQPDLKGKIDRFGGVPGGELRYLIAPYKLYRRIDEFRPTERCAERRRRSEAAYYRCFVVYTERQNLNARPSRRESGLSR